MTITKPVVLALIAAVSLLACAAEPSITCGPGTLADGDRCVADDTDATGDKRRSAGGAASKAGAGG